MEIDIEYYTARWNGLPTRTAPERRARSSLRLTYFLAILPPLHKIFSGSHMRGSAKNYPV
jgi:hypothetical protein